MVISWGWRRWCFLALFLLLNTAAASTVTLKEFVPGSYNAILDSRRGEAFVLVFWSLDCPPCRRELAMLGKLAKERAALPLVLVSTDEIHLSNEVASVLEAHSLSAMESWIFSDDFVQRLRFEVDRHWYGELPRSYFFDPAQGRRATSGILDEEELRAWIRQQLND